MPIFVRDYSWTQTNNTITIKLPIKNARTPKMDLFSTNTFLKINSSPYIFELFLNDAVIERKTKLTIRENEVVVELQKKTPLLWTSLGCQANCINVTEQIQNTIAEEHKKAKKYAKELERTKDETKKFLNGHQMLIINKEKEDIQYIKDRMIKEALLDMDIFPKTKETDNTSHKIEMKAQIPYSIPFPRSDGSISFSFTPRVLPTPKRESTSKEEEQWLIKVAEARRRAGFLEEELTEAERNPEWLLSKGESFMKVNNYLGAVNVFVYGTKLAPNMPDFYVKLAEVHLHLNNFCKSIDNSTKALELLTPVVKQNKTMRAEAYKIRSTAFLEIGEQALSAADLDSSNKLLK